MLIQSADNFCHAEDLFNTLRVLFKAGPHVTFHGTYPIEEDHEIAPKQRVEMVAHEIWQLTGYRFT